jgi:hypothetical protein
MKKQYFIKPKALICDGRFTAKEQDYICLIYSIGRKSACYISNEYLAGYFNVDIPAVRKMLRKLKKHNILIVRQFKTSKNRTIKRYMEISDSCIRGYFEEVHKRVKSN